MPERNSTRLIKSHLENASSSCMGTMAETGHIRAGKIQRHAASFLPLASVTLTKSLLDHACS